MTYRQETGVSISVASNDCSCKYRVCSTPLHSTVFVILGLFGSACFEDTGPIGGDGETGGKEEPASCWCATVEDAEVDPTAGPSELIEDPLNDNGSPKDCVGADEDTHADLLNIASGNLAIVTAVHTDLVSYRDEVFDAAESYCDFLADEQGGTGSTNDCNSILVPGTSPLEYDVSRMCTVGADVSSPSDGWSDYYQLTSVVDYTSTGVYEVDSAFFEDMLHNPGWLETDSGYIALNGNSDFAFFNVGPRDVIYALGIRSGDVPQTLNSYDVTSLLEVSAAYMALWGETSFELVVNRPGVGPFTLDYAIVP